jgi:hypothetical protein
MVYYYKARMYSPTLGRFMQTDPIAALEAATGRALAPKKRGPKPREARPAASLAAA